MLVAAQGMVQLYGDLAYNEGQGLNNRDLLYAKQKVANGLGSVTLIIIAIKMLDKLYYRERLLPARVYNWLQRFYEDAEEEENKHRQTLGNLAAAAADLRTSVVSAASQGFNDRASIQVVDKVKKMKQFLRFGPSRILSPHILISHCNLHGRLTWRWGFARSGRLRGQKCWPRWPCSPSGIFQSPRRYVSVRVLCNRVL